MTTTTTIERRKKAKERMGGMAKTIRPEFVEIDGKGYDVCPYPECDFMLEDTSYSAISGLRLRKIASPDDIYGHIREVHRLVWLRKGKTAGWWSLDKFHKRQEEVK